MDLYWNKYCFCTKYLYWKTPCMEQSALSMVINAKCHEQLQKHVSGKVQGKAMSVLIKQRRECQALTSLSCGDHRLSH